MAKGAQAIMTMRRGIMGSRGKTPPSPAEGKSKGQPVSISFSETPTSQPLTKGVPEDMAKGAVKMLINVMKYMGDYPTKKELDPFELMQKVCTGHQLSGVWICVNFLWAADLPNCS